MSSQFDPPPQGLGAGGTEPADPLLVTAAPEAAPVSSGRRALAVLAAAVVALLGGLAWAAISAATGYNLGILAFAIGAGTGFAAYRVAGGQISGLERGLAAVFAAIAVIIGDYVLFVHEVRVHEGAILATHGISDGYFSHYQISFFLNHFGTIVHGLDYAWIAIAAYAAFRTTGGSLRRRNS